MSLAETCVCCGSVIPEGRQVCFDCEAGAHIKIDSFRAFKLSRGDEFRLDNVAVKNQFGVDIRNIKVGAKFSPNLVCTERIKRKWYQIWKPKYKFASFIYFGE